ncbi:MAG: hypothetical protein IKF53_06420 [Clostridia bacterium]|nr:hypothetical protein [Clostridia bacterium]
MKWESIKKENTKTFLQSDFSGGIGETFNNKNNFKTSENLISKGNSLVTRNALRVCENFTARNKVVGNMPFRITETVYFVDGLKYNVGYHSSVENNNHNKICTYLISSGENILNTGDIVKSLDENHQEDTDYTPVSSVFFTGTKTLGLGIYAFVGYTTNTGRKVYAVFEATGTTNEAWHEFAENELYIPTLLINGRGENYLESEEYYNRTTKEPSSPEKVNMICPYVKCYFSADSFSSYFEMPFSYYEYVPANIKVYISQNEVLNFDFTKIGPVSVTSRGKTYTAIFNEISGSISFVKDDKPSPMLYSQVYPENNIVVTAVKRDIIDPDPILSCKHVVSFNSRLYFYGTDLKPNCVFSSKVTNPLYFPESMKTLVGSDTEAIKGSGYQNNKLIIFKEGETYKVNTTNAYNEVDFYSPEKNVRFKTENLWNESISTKTGALSGDTVASSTGQLVWMGNDKKIYTLEATTYGSEKNIFTISEKVDHLIKKALSGGKKPYATVRDGYYYLFCGEYVFVADCHITNMGYATRYGAKNMNSVSWYVWRLPIEKISGVKNIEEIMICTENETDKTPCLFHFTEDKCDRIFDQNNNLAEKEIETSFETHTHNLSDTKSILSQIKLNLTSDLLDVYVQIDNKIFKKHIHNIKDTLRINPPLTPDGFDNIKIALKSKGDFCLKKISINHKAVV